jgi:hypothetical protein
MAKLFVEVTLRAIKDGAVYYESVGKHKGVEEGMEFNTFRNALNAAGAKLAEEATAAKAEGKGNKL